MADRYWVGGTGTWDNSATTHWATSTGGVSGASAPTSSDNVIFDAASNTGTSNFTVTLGTSAACADFTASGLDGIMTLGFGTAGLVCAGSLSFPASNFATSGTAATLTFSATSGTKTITTNGITVTCDVTFNGVGGTWQLAGNLNANRTCTLTNGTLDLNGFTLSGTDLVSNNANTRTLAFGSGKFSLTGNNRTVVALQTVTGLTVTGTPNIEAIYAGATGTRVFNIGGTAGENETNSISLKLTGGTDAIQLIGSFRSVDFTGCAGTLSNQPLKFYGDVTYVSGMTYTSGGNALTFAKTTGTQTFTASGVTLNQAVTLNGAGGTLALGSNILNSTTRTLSLANGTLNLAGFTFTIGLFTVSSGTKNLTFNGGTLIVIDSGATAFNNANPTNFTTTAGTGTGTISMTSASAKTFVGGGSTFNCTLNQGGAGTLTITGSNTFSDFTNTVNSTTVQFTAATTTTFAAGGFHLGTTTITSATAANHNLSMVSGTVNVSNNTISRSQAAGGATWNSYTTNGNTDGGNNSGWIFTAPMFLGNFLPFL